jgi:uncharacterized protein (DUF58 family)
MFNDTWIALILIIALLGIALGQGALLAIAALLLTVAPIAWLWNRYALHGVRYERAFSETRAFVGETVDLTLRVTNRKPLPLPWLRIEDSLPLQVPLVDHELRSAAIPLTGILTHLASLGWYERITWRYQLRPDRRGFYFFGPAHLRSGDVFGLLSREARAQEVDRLIVYPRVVPLPELGFPGKHPFGDHKAPQPIFEDPNRTVGVRDYHPEDTFKRIHWKATARHQELQVKVYEPTISQHLVIFLNVTTFPEPWMGIEPVRQEHAITVAASIAYHAAAKRYGVGLIANGSVPKSDQPIKVPPGRDPSQLTRILEALAAVTRYATTTIEQLLSAESPRLPWGATLVVVTTVVTEELLAAMVRLRDAGRRLALVSLDPKFKEVALPGITIYHLPEAEIVFGADREEAEA